LSNLLSRSDIKVLGSLLVAMLFATTSLSIFAPITYAQNEYCNANCGGASCAWSCEGTQQCTGPMTCGCGCAVPTCCAEECNGFADHPQSVWGDCPARCTREANIDSITVQVLRLSTNCASTSS
jgi:hypothetical protein